MTARRNRYNVAHASVSNGAFYSLASSVFLAVVFALELRLPGRLVFAGGDKWRDPFFYACVIAWSLLLFGVVFHCTVLTLGRRRGHLIQLSRAARPAVVLGLFWVAMGLYTAAAAFIFVFLGMRNRARLFRRRRSTDFFQEWALPVLSGIVPAVLNGLMGLFCATAGLRAARSVKSLSSRSRSSRERSNESSGRNIGLPVEDPDASRPFDNYSELPVHAYAPAQPMYDAYPPAPPPAHAPNRPPTRVEIDGMLETLRNMGFSSERENYAALYASNFDIQVATQRLVDAQH